MPAILPLLLGSTEGNEGPQEDPEVQGRSQRPQPRPVAALQLHRWDRACLPACLPHLLFVINKELQTPSNANLQLAEATISLPGS